MFIRSDKNVAEALGIVFLLVMLLGFTPNPLVSPTGIFMVNAAHNMLHGMLGLVLLAGAWRGYGKMTLIGVGVAYLLLGVAGYMGMAGDMVMLNMADHYLHLFLGVVLVAAGAYVKPTAAGKR